MISPDVTESIRDFLRRELATGFISDDEATRTACQIYQSENDATEVAAAVRTALEQTKADRAKDMASWPKITDCDRLDAAFEELNARGIMARHHWWCCGPCGEGAMSNEFDRLKGQWQGKPVIGYTFYYSQGTESAADGNGFALWYGSMVPTEDDDAYEAAAVQIAQQVVDVLVEHGIEVSWNGTHAMTILVSLDWKRRKAPERFTEEWANSDGR